MKRVLVISYYWPPSGGSGVQRWVKFAKYLPAQGWQCVVYTPENPELLAVDRTLENDVPDGTEVLKTRIFEPYSFYRKLLGGKSASEGGSNEVNPVNSQKKTFLQRLAMKVRGNFFIPDPRVLWVRKSVRFLKDYLRDHPVDVIVSTGPPHSMHLIAMKLSRECGLPWIADFRDPWTKMFYFKHLELSGWARLRHERLEKQVLDNATVVVAVSPIVQEEFRSMTETPVELITNGFDEDDFADALVEDDGYFNITHTGLFAADGNPDVLWKVLSEKCADDEEFRRMLRIRLVGKTDRDIVRSILEASLAENLIDNGYQPHPVAVKEQKSASLLILPLRKEPEYRATLPGKLFEYLASGRPVLGIGQPDGAMAQILRQSGAGQTFDWDDYDGIAKFIDGSWEAFRNGTLQVDVEGTEQFSRRSTARKMAELMDRIVNIP